MRKGNQAEAARIADGLNKVITRTRLPVTPFIARIALLLTPLLALVPSAATARTPQPAPRVIARIAPERVAWFERYQEARKGAEANQTIVRTFKARAGHVARRLQHGRRRHRHRRLGRSDRGDGDEAGVGRRREGAAREHRRGLQRNCGPPGGEDVARARAQQPARRGELTIDVPFDTPVFVRTLSGDVTVARVRGDLQVESTSGTVEATGTPRVLRLKTISGDVRITDASAPGRPVGQHRERQRRGQGLKARGVEAVSVSGDLVLINTACDRAQLRTVNGDVQYVGSMSKGGRYEISSHSGDVRFELVGNGGFELSARTVQRRGELRAAARDGEAIRRATTSRDAEEPRPPRHLRRRQRAADRQDLQRRRDRRPRGSQTGKDKRTRGRTRSGQRMAADSGQRARMRTLPATSCRSVR